jgi:hypothetical protein
MKYTTLIFCAVFLFFGIAGHAKATTITGSTWPTSGAATAGTSGLSSITGGTHVSSTDLPPGSAATGYITGADNATLNFRVDGTTVPLQTDNDYWLRYWVRAATNATTLAADGTNVNIQYVADGSTKLTTLGLLRNGGASTNNSTRKGIGFEVNEFLPGGSTIGAYGTTVGGVQAILPFNKWGEITIHLHKDGKNGEYAMYFNRSLIRLRNNLPTLQQKATFTADASTDTITSAGHNMAEGEAVTLATTGTLPAGLATSTTYYVRNPTANTFQLSLSSGGAIVDITGAGTGTHTYDNGGISLAALGSQWTMALTGVNGITWQIGGPIVSSSQATIDNTPLVDLFSNSNDWVTKIYPSSYNNLTYGGEFWDQTAGAMSVSATSYTTGGADPSRGRFILSGSATNTATLATTMNIGTLPYNSNGWATLFFPMIYLPSSGALNIAVNDTSGNSIYQVDINGGYLKQNGVNKAPWVATDRYFLALHFSNTGQVNYSLSDLTSDITTQNFWSGQLSNWTPQTIGRVNYLATRGGADLELDGLAVARWLPLFGVDSLTAANAYLVTPGLAMQNHITDSLADTTETSMFPGAAYLFSDKNIPRFFSWGIVGRPGRTRQNFTDNILPYMTYSRGIIMTFADGGSINDIATIYSDENARTTVVNTLLGQLSQAITQLTGNQNRVWLNTMINRVQGTSYTTTERNAILDYDAGIKTLHHTFPSTYFSDPAADIADPSTLFSAGDDTHFNAAGDIADASAMVTDMLNNTPTYKVGGTISNLTGTVVFQNNSGNDLSIPANGSFVFTTTLNDLASYNVTILTQPTNQTCSITNGSGTIAGADTTNVQVSCVNNDTTPPTTTATPTAGTYITSQSVTLSCTDNLSGCNHTYYTIDGTTPTTGSTVYSSPISISSTTTLKFFSNDISGNSESPQTQTYTIHRPHGQTFTTVTTGSTSSPQASSGQVIPPTPPTSPQPLSKGEGKGGVVSSTSYNFGTTTLKLGSKGDTVKELQRYLNDTMKLNLKVDGVLGKNTIAIIKKWQKDHGITPDGVIGAKTKAIMNADVK